MLLALSRWDTYEMVVTTSKRHTVVATFQQHATAFSAEAVALGAILVSP